MHIYPRHTTYRVFIRTFKADKNRVLDCDPALQATDGIAGVGAPGAKRAVRIAAHNCTAKP